jgi:hypothetical protein
MKIKILAVFLAAALFGALTMEALTHPNYFPTGSIGGGGGGGFSEPTTQSTIMLPWFLVWLGGWAAGMMADIGMSCMSQGCGHTDQPVGGGGGGGIPATCGGSCFGPASKRR